MTGVKQVTVPERVWGRLASEADNRGVTVEDVLVEAINHVIRPQDRREQIVVLALAGWTDRDIAERTGEVVGFVATVRRQAGIPANKRGNRRTA